MIEHAVEMIELERLHAHPANANVMPARALAKLREHIRLTGRCPPLVVRPHPEHTGAFELLDGHHRALVLGELGHVSAPCAVWDDVDDDQAALLLATLNRLHGSDDPQRRGRLLAQIAARHGERGAASLLPDTREQIDRLINLAAKPPPKIAPPPDVADMAHPLTFFLTDADRRRVLERLREIDPHDRTRALLMLIQEPRG